MALHGHYAVNAINAINDEVEKDISSEAFLELFVIAYEHRGGELERIAGEIGDAVTRVRRMKRKDAKLQA